MFSIAQQIQGLVAMVLDSGRLPEKFMLWVDAVGGFRVCLADAVTIGQPGEQGGVEVPILGDLSHRHARIRRDAEGYLIEAIRDVRVDGRRVETPRWLSDGSRIELGEGVRLLFRRPHPLSASARLELASRHRLVPAADTVVLMGESCVLGPRSHSHIICRNWSKEVILFRQEDRLYCHAPAGFTIDGVSVRERGRLSGRSRVAGEGFSFSLEPIEE